MRMPGIGNWLIFLVIAGLFLSVDTNAKEKGLIGYWNFDEGKGEIAKDKSGNNLDGEIIGAEWVKGKKGYALEFNGENAYVEIESPHIAENISVMAWVKSSDYSRLQHIVSTRDKKLGYILQTTLNNIAYGYVSIDGNLIPVEGKTKLINNEWVHLAITYDGKLVKLYVNGKLDKESKEVSGEITLGNSSLHIGAQGTPLSYYFLGIIDEVKIYNRALTLEEIMGEYQGVSVSEIKKIAEEKKETEVKKKPESKKEIPLPLKEEIILEKVKVSPEISPEETFSLNLSFKTLKEIPLDLPITIKLREGVRQPKPIATVYPQPPTSKWKVGETINLGPFSILLPHLAVNSFRPGKYYVSVKIAGHLYDSQEALELKEGLKFLNKEPVIPKTEIVTKTKDLTQGVFTDQFGETHSWAIDKNDFLIYEGKSYIPIKGTDGIFFCDVSSLISEQCKYLVLPRKLWVVGIHLRRTATHPDSNRGHPPVFCQRQKGGFNQRSFLSL